VRLTIVGSGTAAPEAERVCSGYLLDHDDTRLLFDCGPGVVHHLARFGLPWPRLDHVFLTHFHNDHTGDLPMLLFALKHTLRPARTRPLTLWGPHGLQERLRAMEAALGSHVADPGFPLLIRELTPGDAFAVGSVSVRVADTPHTPESVCYRVEAGGATVGYTGDTGPSDEVGRFMADVDVLVAECSLPDAEAMETHLTPASAARLAAVASPRRLVLTHVYPHLGQEDVPALVRAAGWRGNAVRAVDGSVHPVDGS
jgi:ribonuclease BN (tRNA processing enzyme)